jgi:hypothetical protein
MPIHGIFSMRGRGYKSDIFFHYRELSNRDNESVIGECIRDDQIIQASAYGAIWQIFS